METGVNLPETMERSEVECHLPLAKPTSGMRKRELLDYVCAPPMLYKLSRTEGGKENVLAPSGSSAPKVPRSDRGERHRTGNRSKKPSRKSRAAAGVEVHFSLADAINAASALNESVG
jgi:hypothetical protein